MEEPRFLVPCWKGIFVLIPQRVPRMDATGIAGAVAVGLSEEFLESDLSIVFYLPPTM